jgi:hypothetical protein
MHDLSRGVGREEGGEKKVDYVLARFIEAGRTEKKENMQI